MQLPYTYSPANLDYDIEILVEFRCTWSGLKGTSFSPPEGPEFEIDGIFYNKDEDKLSSIEEKKLIDFLSEDQTFYSRMCEENMNDYGGYDE